MTAMLIHRAIIASLILLNQLIFMHLITAFVCALYHIIYHNK